MSFLDEIRRRNVFKVGVAYAAVSWLLIQIVTSVEEPLGLPFWFDTAVIVFLAIGLPIALMLAWAFELTPSGVKLVGQGDTRDEGRQESSRAFNFLLAGLAIGALVSGTILWVLRPNTEDVLWAESEAIPRIEALIESGDIFGAFALATEVESRISGLERLEDLWSAMSLNLSISSEPIGATVSIRPYTDPAVEWRLLGSTPIEDQRVLPASYVFRFEREGHETALRVEGNPVVDTDPGRLVGQSVDLFVELEESNSSPAGMVRVPGWEQELDGELVEFQDYYLGRYEVTNREYKRFVDERGYEVEEYWEHPFLASGVEISWQEAMYRFVDATGIPGPASWIGGSFSSGRDDYPVTGISWYEADAYAEFAGVELPSIYHWRRAVSDGLAVVTLPASNLSGSQLAGVGAYSSVNWAGNYDMTGNAREWTYNQLGGQRTILGGGWSDPLYFGLAAEGVSVYSQDPMDRSDINGFRIALVRDPNYDLALESVVPSDHLPDWSSEEPVSDEVFEAYRRNYEYDASPLDPETIEIVAAPGWTRETVLFDSPSGDERLRMHLFLPTNASPPYQTAVLWPGAGAFGIRDVDEFGLISEELSFIMTNGRVLALPVLEKTLERGFGAPFPDRSSAAMRDLTIGWVKDFRRSLDYLETRSDIDPDKFAYVGNSWGGAMAPNILAVEPRFKAAVLSVAGMLSSGTQVYQPSRDLPEVYAFNYLPRVTLPTLMLNGELDQVVPLKTSAEPFFELIGTQAVDKEHVVARAGHYVPQALRIRETLDWLDRYLGPPRR